MERYSNRGILGRFLWELWPALATLLATLIIATFIAEFTFTFGEKAPAVVLWRFLRLFLNLSFPLLLLPGICTVIQKYLNRGNHQLIYGQQEGPAVFHPIQSWVFRPLQGIGLMMFLAGHFMRVLREELPLAHSAPPPPGGFTWERSLNLVVASLLLLFLWTMGDLGIRHYNKKTGEVRLMGRILGLVLPVLTGFYGMLHYFNNQPPLAAIFLIAQVIIIF